MVHGCNMNINMIKCIWNTCLSAFSVLFHAPNPNGNLLYLLYFDMPGIAVFISTVYNSSCVQPLLQPPPRSSLVSAKLTNSDR